MRGDFRWRLYGLFALVLVGACVYEAPPPPFKFPDPVSKRESPEASDPKIQKKCQEKGKTPCLKDSSCEKLCSEIFTSRRNEKDCLELSKEMVLDFEHLLKSASKGRWEQIDPYILECLLDIDEVGFSKALKKVGKHEARDFLFLITEDRDLASVLEKEDDDFHILKRLMREAFSNRTLTSLLTEKIEDSKSFLYFTGVNWGEEAFQYLDAYVSEKCESGGGDCPGEKPIGAYCQALLNFKSRVLEDFLSSADVFADDYKDEVEDAGFEYERKGFEDYCEDWLENHNPVCTARDGSTDSACPSSPPSQCKLADITLVTGRRYGYFIYTRPGGFNLRSSGWRDWLPEGSINPSTNKIDSFYTSSSRQDRLTIVILSSTTISAVADPDNSWYIYVDGIRYSMTERLPRFTNQVPEVYFYEFGKTGTTTTTYGVHLAYEDSSGNCHWIRP